MKEVQKVMAPALNTYFPSIAWNWVLVAAPTQTNGNDCGILVAGALLAVAAAFIDGDREPKFPTQTEIYEFRHQIVEEILDAFEN
jgi:Ulp1 family protease